MSDWITDRLPTDDDADREGTVWITRDSAVERTDFLNVMLRQAWMPIDQPPPYQPPPPEPDTSLEADIDFAITWCEISKMNMLLERVQRIAEAARCWDELRKSWRPVVDLLKQDKPGRDPDGVGEHGKKYQERTQAKPDQPPPKLERFEAWIDSCVDCDGNEHTWQHSKRITQVLPSDPKPEWIAELIRLCERPETEGSYGYHEMIQQHLAKRGER